MYIIAMEEYFRTIIEPFGVVTLLVTDILYRDNFQISELMNFEFLILLNTTSIWIVIVVL